LSGPNESRYQITHSSTPAPPARILKFLAVYGSLVTIVVTVLVWHNPVQRAVVGMAWGLIFFWIVVGGVLARVYQDNIRHFVLHVPIDWKIKFVLFATLLALVEEAITTTMTNLAPVFGVQVGQAYITASTNYLDVVLGHSVIVFVPMFIAWAWLLSRYDFRPATVMLLFGLTGTLAEAGTFGLQHLAEVGLWVFVYGLMVYLPAYSVPGERGTKQPGLGHYVLAVFLPFLFVVPVAIVVGYFHPVKIHFPQ